MTCLQVFEPVIGSNSKISAEEIEMGLIKPDSPVAQLHIDLLKVFDSHFLSISLFLEFVGCALDR